jgi:hypothetical protein
MCLPLFINKSQRKSTLFRPPPKKVKSLIEQGDIFIIMDKQAPGCVIKVILLTDFYVFQSLNQGDHTAGIHVQAKAVQ